MVFEREFIDRYLSDDESCVLESDGLQRCARDGMLGAYRHEGFWQCMDTGREHQLLEEMWADGSAPWRVWDAVPQPKITSRRVVVTQSGHIVRRA
jgi:glucose-1-phosphate cytidylyltransferase